MTFHKYDIDTKLYIESVETEEQPENSVSGILPEMTDLYALAFIENEWVSVLK
jgi:hypothetical protein